VKRGSRSGSTTNGRPLWPRLGALVAAALLAGAASAEAVVTAYRWQVQQSGGIGSSGFTANWPDACGNQPDVDNNGSPIVTTMSTAGYCDDDQVRNRRPAGPHDVFLLIKDTAYAATTTVTGQATGNRWALEDDGGGGKTVRLTLGYAQSGSFTAWGFVNIVVPNGNDGLFQPDMSSISGTAPSGSHLALLVTKLVGANNSRLVFHFADNRQNNDDSGQISVDEATAVTTTVGDGTDPTAAPTLCPDGAVTDLDAFTLQTGNGTDTVTSVAVDFTGTLDNIAQVQITDNANGVLGSVSAPISDPQSITVSIGINTTLQSYKVRIVPKTHAAMDPPATGVSTAVTGIVSDITVTNSKSVGDVDSDTVTIDNQSPANAGWGAITPGNNQVSLAWTDPGDADFNEVIIVRNAGAAVPGTPAEGQSYIVTATIPGGGEVVLVGTDAASPWVDTGATNGTNYWYKIYARDNCGNWAVGAETGPHTPAPPTVTTTVGDGTDPTAAPSLCPDAGVTDLDAFTLQTNFSTDTVTSVQVDFTGALDNVGTLQITDATNSVLGSVTAPISDPQNISVSIGVSTTLQNYKIRVISKTHAAMDPPATGVSTAVTGIVSDITVTNSKSAGDVDSDTVTIDNQSPANAGWGAITPGSNQISLSWADPADADFVEVIIVRKQGGALVGGPVEGQTYAVSDPVGDGSVVFVGNDAASPWTDTGVTNGTNYWYKIYARDNCGNWATGAETGPHIPVAPANEVTPQVATAVVNGCNQITVSAPFTGDVDTDSSTTFRRGTAAGGPFSDVCTGVTGASPRTCPDSGVAQLTNYWYEVDFTDPDGVIDLNPPTDPQVIGPFATPACSADDTTVGSNSANANSCSQITVTNVFTGDANGDGSTEVQYNTVNSFPASIACGTLTGVSPRECLVTGLSETTSYWVQVTVTDPDGVTGTNPEVLGPIATPACGADNMAPTVLVLAPSRDATVTGIDRVKVQVWDAIGLAAANPVQWSVDGGASSSATESTTYTCGTNCKVFEFDLDTTALSDGGHFLSIQASDSKVPANVATVNWGFQAMNAASGGSGYLLRRTHGSQLCRDCHNLSTHSSQHTSTKYGNWALDCLTCHTPHKTTNVFLIREALRTPNSGTKSVLFHFDDRVGETNPGSAPGDFSFLGDRSGASNTPYDDGVCESCHTKTNHWRNSTTGGDHSHNAAVRCLKCHTHETGFRGGGDCLDCHSTEGQDGTIGPNNRRPVLADFTKQSHHVGDGTATMGGTLTAFDCVVCHAEGKAVGIDPNIEIQLTSWHNDGLGTGGVHRIDLKDVDNWSDATDSPVFSYDKRAVCDAVSGSDPNCADAENAVSVTGWGSGNTTWRTQTSTSLDPFCLTCHDADGATAAANQTQSEGCSATASNNFVNPFCDGAITNEYDQTFRNPADPTTGPGRVVDVKSRVTATTDQDGDGIPDPPQGIYSRHAIRGQSLSVYQSHTDPASVCENGLDQPCGTMYEGDDDSSFAPLLIQVGVNDDGGRPLWNDTSVMGCADCHTVDGANGIAGNAHGSDSEYLLKNSTGGATEGRYIDGSTFTYVCYRCHDARRYRMDGAWNDHTDKDSDWADTVLQTAGSRRNNDGNTFGMACTNCHGGGPGNTDQPGEGFGQIHGTSSTYGIGNGGGSGTRNAYRFMNGASLRYFDPDGGWADERISCWTLGGSGDEWGACTQHGGGSRTFDKPLARQLRY